MSNALVVGGIAASLLAGPVAISSADRNEAPPSGVTFSVATYNGSGCPAGTAQVYQAADNTAFTIRYDRYRAEDANAGDFRKNCQINLRVNIPQGFTFAIARAEYRGRVKVTQGAYAVQGARYYFTGSSQTMETEYQINGPYTGQWNNVDDVAASVYSPCGATTNLNINTDLRVRTGSAGSTRNWIAMDKTQGNLDNIYHVSWKRC